MRQVLAQRLLLLVVTCGCIWATYEKCPGCIDRGRVNKTCEWIGDSTFPLVPANEAHQTHLIADAQLAEELAVRYADSAFNRLYGYEAHGGLIDGGRVRNECMVRLVHTIEKNHAVTAEQVQSARGRRNQTFDSAVAVLFIALYSFAATIACHSLHRRFGAHSRSVRFVATGLASIAASFLGLQVGQLWLSLWEVVRVGNGHMSSFRAATHNHWTHQHIGALFGAAVLLFYVIATFACHAASEREQVDDDVRGFDVTPAQ
jgi:hypothetical protein